MQFNHASFTTRNTCVTTSNASKRNTVMLKALAISAACLFAAALFASVTAMQASADQILIQNEGFVRRLIPAPAAPPAKNPDIKEGTSDKTASDETVAAPAIPSTPVDPDSMILHLRDGSKVRGKLNVKELIVDTQFGRLTVPVANLISIRPGLNSVPEFGQQVLALVTALGGDDFNAREEAQKKLVTLGSPIRRLLETQMKDDQNAERVRRIKVILEQFDESEDEEWDEESKPQQWIKQDTIVTSDFSIVGDIVQKQFALQSRFGILTAALGDIKFIERQKSGRDPIRKQVAVEGQNIAQKQYKKTNIRLTAGDRVKITADGTLSMTPWGSSARSTPDGAPNYGWFMGNQIAAGALVGRIGDSGTVFKIGTSTTFTAKKSGMLQLAIGMHPSYINNAFPGKYTAKITMTPKN